MNPLSLLFSVTSYGKLALLGVISLTTLLIVGIRQCHKDRQLKAYEEKQRAIQLERYEDVKDKAELDSYRQKKVNELQAKIKEVGEQEVEEKLSEEEGVDLKKEEAEIAKRFLKEFK